MNEPLDQDGQWPSWARYVVFGLLGAIVIAGLVAAAGSGGLSSAAVRIIIAAVVIPVLLAPVQLWGVRRRGGRIRRRLDQDLADVDTELDHELALAARVDRTDDGTLARLKAWVQSTRAQVLDADAAQVGASLDQLATMVRSWPADSALSEAVQRARRTARTLVAVSRRE